MHTSLLPHPKLSRRQAVQAGAIGLLGLGTNHVQALRALADRPGNRRDGKAVIFIFLSGGLSQIDSFDPKPDAPDTFRGEFQPIATRTVGLQICEHLPRLAARSDRWAVVRSLTHPYNEHSEGHHVMLTGRTPKPTGFDPRGPRATDYPCMASIVKALTPQRGNLPPAAVLPEKLVHVTGRTIPGQFAGMLGNQHNPWFIEASQFRSSQYVHGAFPEYGFERRTGAFTPEDYIFEAPSLSLPRGVLRDRFDNRLDLLNEIERQRRQLDQAASQRFDRHRESAVSLMLDPRVRRALDVHSADVRVQERYGRNSFGWSLLMARQLVEAGVRLVQVNLGNDESWDTHESNFRNLGQFLLPPTDRALSALLDDLDERGMLDDTLIVMASEFGRTPRVFASRSDRLPGRDHWGAVQSVFFAGGGVRGGQVIGASDRRGGHPTAEVQRPENMAATIYEALGLPRTIAWHDPQSRPHFVYHDTPISGLTG